MILKIVRDWGSNENPSAAASLTIECDRFDRRGAEDIDSKMHNVESVFGDPDGEVNPKVFLTLLKGNKIGEMRVVAYLLVGNSTVFVMNNEGKTIDKLHV